MGTCETTIFTTSLTIPYIGLCEPSRALLIFCCFLSFVLQFFRHWLYLQHAIVRLNLLSENAKNRSVHDTFMFTLYQFLETCCWIVSLLIVINANVYVLASHLLSDVIASMYLIRRAEKAESPKIQCAAIVDAIKKDPNFWTNVGLPQASLVVPMTLPLKL
jgi:hypothetical protein